MIHQHWCRSSLQDCLSQLCFWETPRQTVEKKRDQPPDQAESVMISCMLYSCEPWTVYSWHARQLNSLYMRCLRKLLNNKWQEKVPDTEVLQRAEKESVYAMLKRFQLRWAGHVSHMPDDGRWYGKIKDGNASLGGQRKCFKDALKVSLKCCKINPASWESAVHNISA